MSLFAPRSGPFLVALALGLLGHAALLAPAAPPRALGALLVLVFLPGFAVAQALLAHTDRPGRDRGEGIETLALACATGYALLVVSALVWHYLPGPLTLPPLLLTADALTLLGLLAGWHRRATLASWRVEPPLALALLGVVLVGGWFRLFDLGYSELQGDEAMVALRAVAAIQGEGEAIFLHKKGPAEILVSAAIAVATGDSTEWTLRLPFALASLASLLALAALGLRWFSPAAAVGAPLLLALNGFSVGFGRIVQYQSLVLVLSLAGVVAFARALPGPQPRPGALALAALLLGAGLLAHYDAGLVAPALLLLVAEVGGRWRWRPAALAPILLAALGGAAVAALFYLPYLARPILATTSSYLADRLGEEGLYNNLGTLFRFATFYNATYYAALLLLGVLLAWHERWGGVDGRRAVRWALAGAVLLLLGAAVLPSPGARWRAALPGLAGLALLSLAALRGRAFSSGWRTAWFWFATPAALYLYLVEDPGTHFYVVFPPVSLLAAAGLSRLLPRAAPAEDTTPRSPALHPAPGARSLARAPGRGASGWRLAAALGAAPLLLLSAAYIQIAFVSHQPEYKRTYPESRPAIFPVLYPSPPKGGFFGFPYQAGWRAIGALYDQGVLAGSYVSNEEHSIVRWYTRNATSCRRAPDWILLAERVQDFTKVPVELVERAPQVADVTVEGRRTLHIHRSGAAPAPLLTYRVEELAGHFAARSGDWRFDTGVRPEGAPPYVPERLDIDLTPELRLLGYRLRRAIAAPGEPLELSLYLQANAPLARDYTLELQLGEAQRWESRAHRSACDTRRGPAAWKVGETVALRHVLPLAPDLGPGDYPLTLELQPVDGEGPPLRQAIATVTIVRPAASRLAGAAGSPP